MKKFLQVSGWILVAFACFYLMGLGERTPRKDVEGRIEELEERIDELEGRLSEVKTARENQIGELRGEIYEEIEKLREEIKEEPPGKNEGEKEPEAKKPAEFVNGYILIDPGVEDEGHLTICGEAERDFYVRLRREEDGDVIELAILCAEEETVEANLPYGSYDVWLCTGEDWYGEDYYGENNYFGDSSVWYLLRDKIEITGGENVLELGEGEMTQVDREGLPYGFYGWPNLKL